MLGARVQSYETLLQATVCNMSAFTSVVLQPVVELNCLDQCCCISITSLLQWTSCDLLVSLDITG